MTATSRIKLSRYNVVAESTVGSRLLLFNARSGSKLELTGNDRRLAEAFLRVPDSATEQAWALLDDGLKERLVDSSVVVSRDLDERAAVLQARKRALAMPGPCSFTITPTIQCNFRCPYCFEHHRPQFMDHRTEAATIAFIKAVCPKNQPVSVCWFGGEPLLQSRLIHRVSKRLRREAAEQGWDLHLSIITNGYLLTPAVIDRMQDVDPWDMVQVTLDGMPESHDTRRTLVSGGPTWHRIVRSVKCAVDAGLPVSIRVNIDKSYTVDYQQLISALVDAKVLPLAQLYLGHVTAPTAECGHLDGVVHGFKTMAKERLRLWRALLAVGISPSMEPPGIKCGPMCTAESSRGYVIGPDGRLFKCWNEVASDDGISIGSIFSPDEIDTEHRYIADTTSKEQCHDCHALPVCFGGCGWDARDFDTHGVCGTFRFFPEALVRLSHAGSLVSIIEEGASSD
jgi:uncharacterized protein